MVKKRVSGQTIAIIVLILLLICAITFGAVYAFYSTSTKKVSGTIVMANLYIDFNEDDLKTVSGQSQILISNMNQVVPNESLGNSPLRIVNESTAEIYIAVLYKVERVYNNGDKEKIDYYYERKCDDKGEYIFDEETGDYVYKLDESGQKKPIGVIDIGQGSAGNRWTDFVFDTRDYVEYATDNYAGNDNYIIRSFVTTEPVGSDEGMVTVIGPGDLKLHWQVGNEYQNKSISFTFQAHAIGAGTFDFTSKTPKKEKCAQILKAIYQANFFEFKI